MASNDTTRTNQLRGILDRHFERLDQMSRRVAVDGKEVADEVALTRSMLNQLVAAAASPGLHAVT